MTEKHIVGSESKEIFYEDLEEYARGKIREHLQDLLEQEVTEWLGRKKSERRVNARLRDRLVPESSQDFLNLRHLKSPLFVDSAEKPTVLSSPLKSSSAFRLRRGDR